MKEGGPEAELQKSDCLVFGFDFLFGIRNFDL